MLQVTLKNDILIIFDYPAQYGGDYSLTIVYYIRHAEPNYSNHDDFSRELSPKGLEDRKKVTEFLSDKKVDVIYSSPFLRSIETISHFADKYGFKIITDDRLRERKISDEWIPDFRGYVYAQWADFGYKLDGGESLSEVQERNIDALGDILQNHRDQVIVVSSHGTSLSTVASYFDKSFGVEDFFAIKCPFVLELRFEGTTYIRSNKYDLSL